MRKLIPYFMPLAAMLCFSLFLSCTLDNEQSYKSKGNDIANYKTTQIGDQTWMAENLDYNVNGSVCYGSKVNCATYGRLYDWVTALALPDSCNYEDCSSQILEKHKGICPNGWHIPSDTEWSTLIRFVGLFTPGTKLKATKGWNLSSTVPSGSDDYGFSALPGGGWIEGVGDFGGVGYFGGWWGSSEKNIDDDYRTYVHFQGILYNSELAVSGYVKKSSLLSVRCLQD